MADLTRAQRRRLKRTGAKLSSISARPKDTTMERHAAMVSQGYSHYQSGDYEAADRLYRAVLDENIEHAGALHGMGVIARDAERYEVGVELLRRASLKDPRNVAIHSNLGTTFEQWGRYDEAVASYKVGLRHAPRDWILLNNLGSCYARMGQRTLALSAFEKALRFGGETAELYTNYAVTLAETGAFEMAEPYFRKAIELNPEPSAMHFSYGAHLLYNGRWDEGWSLYERRFIKGHRMVSPRAFRQPYWNGEPLSGKAILLWGEQGIGDEIRFVSMARDVIASGADVTIECAPKLQSLFCRSFPEARVVAAPYRAAEDEENAFDFQCAMGSLGRFYRRGRDMFPRHDGYLKPDLRRAKELSERLASVGPGPRVGVCWRSGLSGAHRDDYYTVVRELGPILKLVNVTFVNLQYDVKEEEIEEAKRRFGATLHRMEGLDLRDDLEGAAALTIGLDLVVSATTSVSVMAGALGVRTLEFLPVPVSPQFLIDDHCPWFPSLRYADKRARDPWSKVFFGVADEMRALA